MESTNEGMPDFSTLFAPGVQVVLRHIPDAEIQAEIDDAEKELLCERLIVEELDFLFGWKDILIEELFRRHGCCITDHTGTREVPPQ
jgi:hypothetical protein